MAKRKKKEVETPEDLTLDFFSKHIDSDVMSASDLGDPDPNLSGSINLDYDLITPFPEGRIVEIFGYEGTCKTTLCLEILGQALQKGKTCLYVNMERNLNASLMKTVRSIRPFLDDAIANLDGGSKDCPLWLAKPFSGEQGLEAMRKFASMCPNGVAVLDSIDAAQPEALLTEDIGQAKVGNLAKLMSDAMRKLIAAAEDNNVTLIFVNQIRQKITMYGDPDEPPGGQAIRFYASQRIKLLKPRKDDYFKDDDGSIIGANIRYKVVKNKVAPDGQEGAFPILYKNGIFRERELVEYCVKFGVLKLGGRGGKQVLLPVLDRDSGEFEKDGDEIKTIAMRQFDVGRRLVLDQLLFNKLQDELNKVFIGRVDAVDSFTQEIDEVQEA